MTSAEEPLVDAVVGIDAAVAEKWPGAADAVYTGPVDFGDENLLPVRRGTGKNFSLTSGDEAVPPEDHSVAAVGGGFKTGAVGGDDGETIGNGVAALNRYPGVDNLVYRIDAALKWLINCSPENSKICSIKTKL